MNLYQASIHFRRIRVVAAGLALLLAACEQTFSPIQQSDYVFSIYGHLEATADTQWIRVTPLRTSLETVPGPIDAVVTLEELETGAAVVMRDSLIRYFPFNLGDVDIYAHNFSTTMPMVPGRHYRLTATRSDGAAASATVLIPVIEDPVLELSIDYYRPLPRTPDLLRPARGVVHGMRHIGMILGLQEVSDGCQLPIKVHQQYLRVLRHGEGDGDPHHGLLEWVEPAGSDGRAEPIEIRPSWVAGPLPCDLEPKRIAVVASGAEWPFGEFRQFREVTHPNAVNTVEGGVGFLAGVQTHYFPFERCVPLTVQDSCKITFSARSATLVGFVTSSCGGGPLPLALVALRGADAGGIRYATTDSEGGFGFKGLDPGVAHSITLSRQGFHDYLRENLTFDEAAVDTIGAEMVFKEVCAS